MAATAVMEPPTMTAGAGEVPVVAEAPATLPRPFPAIHSAPNPVPAVLPVPVPAETVVDLAPAPPTAATPGRIPPPTLAAPAFFTPPPPVRPLTPPEPEEEDERSAPPVALEDEEDVVVEEQFFEEGPAPLPAAMPITQPIRISELHTDLPMPRETSRSGQSLPRLDVSLGGESRGAAVASPVEMTPPAGRTRVFLPSPGSNRQPTSPEDFLTPPPPKSPLPTPEVPITQEPYPDEATDFREPFDPFVEVEVPESIPKYTTIPIPSEHDAIPLDEIESEPELEPELETGDFDAAEGDGESLETTVPPPLLPLSPSFELPEWGAEPIEEVDLPPNPANPSDLRTETETETSSVPLQTPLSTPVSRRQVGPRNEWGEEASSQSLHEGSFAKLFAQQTSAPETPVAERPSETSSPASTASSASSSNEGFEALFDGGGREGREEKGISRTMIVMIASVVAVAIIAGVGVILVINSFLGGFSPAEAYQESEAEAAQEVSQKSGVKPRIPTSAETASAPDLSIQDAPAIVDPPAVSRDSKSPAPEADAPALSFDEKVQQMVNGRGGSVIGSPSLDIVEKPLNDFNGTTAAARSAAPPASTASAAPPKAEGTPPPPAPAPPADPTSVANSASLTTNPPSSLGATPESAVAAAAGTIGAGSPPPSTTPAAATVAKDPNYHPPDSFAAPAPEDKSTLGKTHDLIDAFLRAPDVATRLKYTYQGDSLRAAVEDYHKKWPYVRFGRYSLQLYQMELDASIGGPYWVFIVSTSDEAEGFPFIVRTENGLLKADWEIFAEFSDRQFLRFRDGKMSPPATFRLILERFTDYYGSDREAFTDLGNYLVYQVYPPYGETEFSEFVFVKKDSDLGKKLDKLVGIGDEPLAVVVTLDQQPFAHGVKHYVVTELITEGWFR